MWVVRTCLNSLGLSQTINFFTIISVSCEEKCVGSNRTVIQDVVNVSTVWLACWLVILGSLQFSLIQQRCWKPWILSWIYSSRQKPPTQTIEPILAYMQPLWAHRPDVNLFFYLMFNIRALRDLLKACASAGVMKMLWGILYISEPLFPT